MSPEEAKTALSYGKYIALDTESTGFQPNDKFSFLLEIGAVKYVNGKRVDAFDELINPGIKIPKKIAELTGITDDMVKDKDGYVEVLTKFRKWCDTDKFIFVMHNAGHDLKFLNYFGQKCGVEFDDPYIDTQPLAKNLLKNGYWKKLNNKVNENYKLATLATFFDIRDLNHHRADNDAELTINVFFKLKQVALRKDPMLNIMQDWKYPNDCENNISKAIQEVKVLSISPWDKKKRLYVSLSTLKDDEEKFATVYFDFDYNCWGIKSTGFPITSFKELEEEVKHIYKTNSMNYDDFNERKYFSNKFLSLRG